MDLDTVFAVWFTLINVSPMGWSLISAGRGNNFHSLSKGKKDKNRDFSDGPVAKTPHTQCRAPRFDP